MNSYSPCNYDISETIQGQSLPLSAIIEQYVRTGVAPAPLPLSSFEFNKDLSDKEMDELDGFRLDHDLSELDSSQENLKSANDRLASLKALIEKENKEKSD